MAKLSIPPSIFLWLTFAAGIILLAPAIDVQRRLSTSDNGRDLYAFERTLRGDVPYQDYAWPYGPVMPYYYAAVNHLLGVTIKSVLTGKALLTLASGLFIFLTLETLAGALAGFAGALWFFAFGRDFFFTYNHAGGIACIAFIMLCLARYITTRRDDWLWTGLVAAFILSLIKANFGLVAIPMLMFAASLTDKACAVTFNGRKKFFYLFSAILLPLIIAAVYWIFLYGSSWTDVRQCLPLSGTDPAHAPCPLRSISALVSVFWQNTLTRRTDFILAVIVVVSLFQVLYKLAGREMELNERKMSLLTLILFAAYFLLNIHEYLDDGLWSRTFWAQPAGIVWMFALAALALKGFSRVTRGLVFGTLIILAAVQGAENLAQLRTLHSPEHYLSAARGKTFIDNPPEWARTLQNTAEYLERTVPSDEPFFAFPSGALYYYLAGKRSPARTLQFSEESGIQPEEEEKILKELETARVNFVVVSNQPGPDGTGASRVKSDRYPLIKKYIDENFTPVAEFGGWQDNDGSAGNYGTTVLQRKGLRQ